MGVAKAGVQSRAQAGVASLTQEPLVQQWRWQLMPACMPSGAIIRQRTTLAAPLPRPPTAPTAAHAPGPCSAAPLPRPPAAPSAAHTHLGGVVQRAGPVLVWQAGLRPAVQQHACQLLVAGLDGQVQRTKAIKVQHVRIGTCGRVPGMA